MQEIRLKSKTENGPVWLDYTAPNESELKFLTETYHLHPLILQDCLQPEHLPKFDNLGNGTSFLIIRYYDPQAKNNPDNLQDLSNKVAIFYNHAYVITMHNHECDFLEKVVSRITEWQEETGKDWTPTQIAGRILRESGNTYLAPARKIEAEIDFYENRIFMRSRTPNLLPTLYLLKRKTSFLKRLVQLSREPVQEARNHAGNKHSHLFRDIADRHLELEIIYDQLQEELQQALNLYISLSAQKSNEVMRILTIFSVFFLPLTFIVGVYGMNFKYIPEIDWPMGYALVWMLMALITSCIYIWFRWKKWL